MPKRIGVIFVFALVFMSRVAFAVSLCDILTPQKATALLGMPVIAGVWSNVVPRSGSCEYRAKSDPTKLVRLEKSPLPQGVTTESIKHDLRAVGPTGSAELLLLDQPMPV